MARSSAANPTSGLLTTRKGQRSRTFSIRSGFTRPVRRKKSEWETLNRASQWISSITLPSPLCRVIRRRAARRCIAGSAQRSVRHQGSRDTFFECVSGLPERVGLVGVGRQTFGQVMERNDDCARTVRLELYRVAKMRGDPLDSGSPKAATVERGLTRSRMDNEPDSLIIRQNDAARLTWYADIQPIPL